MGEQKYFLISALGHSGSYEYIAKGEADFADKAALAFANDGGVVFDAVTGETVAISNASAVGLAVKQVEAADVEKFLQE